MATIRSKQTTAQKYQSMRRSAGYSSSQTSYALTLQKRQQAAEDDYYDNAYTNGQITAEQYIGNLNTRLGRTALTPLQKQNLQQKVTSVNKDYQDQLVETAYKTGALYNGAPVTTQTMIDRAQTKLDSMSVGSEAYSKQQLVVQQYKDKLQSETDKANLDERKQYRQQELLKLSNMRESSSVELQNKANMYAKLEAMARADGDTQEADNYLVQKNNLQQAADRAGVTERIQDVNLKNSQPVSPMPSNPTQGQVSSTEQQFAGGQVPTADNQSVVDYYVNEAKNQGMTNPADIKQYIDNQGLSIDVTLPQIQQSMTAGMVVPTITPEVVTYAGISLDKKVYDRIKTSKEVQAYLEKNTKMINQIQGEPGKNNGLVNQIASQMDLVNALKTELNNAKPDNRDSIMTSYNNAVEKYNGLVQRKDDMMQTLQEQQTGFQEVITKKASTIMKEQDSEFEKELKTQIDNTQTAFSQGKLSKEEYVATLHGIAGTPFEQQYKQNLVNQLQKKGIKINPGASFDEISKAAVSNNLKSEAEITKELYGLYGVGQQMYSLRGSLYDNIGDVATKDKISTLEADYSLGRKRISEYVIPNIQNLRVVQSDEGNDTAVNLTNMKMGIKKGEYTLVDPTADAAQKGITPQDATKDWENSHIQVGGVWYPVRNDTSKSQFRTPEAKKAQAEFGNTFVYRKIDPVSGKETVVPVKGVDYGNGATRYIPNTELDKLMKTNYVVQQGNKLVRNYNSGQQDQMNPIYKGALQVAASPVGTVLKDVMKGLPGIGPVMQLLDNSKAQQSNKKQATNPVQGFLDMAKNALIKPVFAGDTTKSAAFSQTPQQSFEALVKPIAQKYGIPMAVIMGQYAAEGRDKGTGASRNNFFNIGGFDGQEANMPSYKTPQEGIDAYAKLLATDPRYAKAYALRGNPAAMIKAIQDAGYAGDPTTYSQRASNSYPTYSSFVMDTPEYKKYAVVPTATPTPAVIKPTTVVSQTAPKSSGVNSFIQKALEAVSNVIAPPVSGATPQTQSQPQPQQQSSGGGGGGGGGGSWGGSSQPQPQQQSVQQAVSQVKSTPQAQAAVQQIQQQPIMKALEPPKVSQPSAQLKYTPPAPAKPAPAPQQNFIQKAATAVKSTVSNAAKTVSNWFNSLFKR